MPDDRRLLDEDAVLPATVGPAGLADVVTSAMAGEGDVAARRWAGSGAMALTGSADGRPDVGPARVALAMDAVAADVARTSTAVGSTVQVDGAALLGERAAIAGFTRQGSVSCGGATHLLPTSDGETVALSLARDDDWTLLPALFALVDEDYRDAAVAGDGTTPRHGSVARDDWGRVRDAVARVRAAELVAAAVELGLAVGRLGEASATQPLVRIEATAPASRRPLGAPWTVVDLSSLWAGPLCANLLALAGARVIKVESTRRPDGARLGPPAFFDLLNGGHESVALDLATDGGRSELRRLLAAADVVIEASRPRALVAMHASHADLVADGWRGVWLSITGHGRDGAAADRIAFGDDAAVAGGLVGHASPGDRGTNAPFTALSAATTARRSGAVGFCADAVADPATGLLAAAAVLRAMAGGASGLIAVSLAATAAHLAAGVAANPPVTLPAGVTPAAPYARAARLRAAPLGQHTGAWRP